MEDKVSSLKKIKELFDQGLLTSDEFDLMKKEILETNYNDNLHKENESQNISKYEENKSNPNPLEILNKTIIDTQESNNSNYDSIKEIKTKNRFTLGNLTPILLILFIVVFGVFVFSKYSNNKNNSSSSINSGGKKTSFDNCIELVEYTRYKTYSDLKSEWGEGNIGEPWDASAVGDLNMKVKVRWSNIKCNGNTVEIMFVNGNIIDKMPTSYDGIFCDAYNIRKTETVYENTTNNTSKTDTSKSILDPAQTQTVSSELTQSNSSPKNEIINDFNGEGSLTVNWKGKQEVHYFSEGLATAERDGKWGYIDKNGNEIISCKFDGVNYFDGGVAKVKLNGKNEYIDKKGNVINTSKYEFVCDFKEGISRVSLNGKFGYIDNTGREIIPCEFKGADVYFHEGMTGVEFNQKWGFFDKDGNKVTPFIYDSTKYFVGGIASVKLNGKWVSINKKGR